MRKSCCPSHLVSTLISCVHVHCVLSAFQVSANLEARLIRKVPPLNSVLGLEDADITYMFSRLINRNLSTYFSLVCVRIIMIITMTTTKTLLLMMMMITMTTTKTLLVMIMMIITMTTTKTLLLSRRHHRRRRRR